MQRDDTHAQLAARVRCGQAGREGAVTVGDSPPGQTRVARLVRVPCERSCRTTHLIACAAPFVLLSDVGHGQPQQLSRRPAADIAVVSQRQEAAEKAGSPRADEGGDERGDDNGHVALPFPLPIQHLLSCTAVHRLLSLLSASAPHRLQLDFLRSGRLYAQQLLQARGGERHSSLSGSSPSSSPSLRMAASASLLPHVRAVPADGVLRLPAAAL